MRRPITTLLLISLFFEPVWGLANTHTASAEAIPIGRYLTVATQAPLAQRDLLKQLIQVRFPIEVQTVGQAMQYLLRLSGYHLIPTNEQTVALRLTLTQPLPAVERDLGPMALQEALITLAGPAFYLAQNPLHRTVNFVLKPQYARFTPGEKAPSAAIKKRGKN